MTKYTQKALRELVTYGLAFDVTDHDAQDAEELKRREGYVTQIGYAECAYGCNGALFEGHNSGSWYAITSRTKALFLYT